MRARWRPRAIGEFGANIRYLNDRNPAAAREMRDDVRAAVIRLAERPYLGRTSNFAGHRVWSLPKWSKLIVYRTDNSGIEIVRLLDTRMTPPESL